MIAVDTNVVVRYLTNDDPDQSPKAKAYIDGQEAFISDTVLLETEWVLRTILKVKRETMADILGSLVALPTVRVFDRSRIECAFVLMRSGMDFADALHLVGAESCEAFVTFDKTMARFARGSETIPVRLG